MYEIQVARVKLSNFISSSQLLNTNQMLICLFPSMHFYALRYFFFLVQEYTAVAQWLRCGITNRKVAGSIPAGVIGIFHWHKILPIALWPWGRLSLWHKWVPGAFPGGKGGRCVRLTTLPPSCAVVMISRNLNFLEPSGPLEACNGTALPLQEYMDTGLTADVFVVETHGLWLSVRVLFVGTPGYRNSNSWSVANLILQTARRAVGPTTNSSNIAVLDPLLRYGCHIPSQSLWEQRYHTTTTNSAPEAILLSRIKWKVRGSETFLCVGSYHRDRGWEERRKISGTWHQLQVSLKLRVILRTKEV